MSNQLTQEEVRKKLILYLSLLDATQPYGTELYNAISRVTVRVAIEAISLRIQNGRYYVLMTQRGQDESYPGQWHCPGSVIRSGDTVDDVRQRLSNEFGCTIKALQEVCGFNNPNEKTGHAFCWIHLCELSGTTSNGTWFLVDDLPEKTIIHHRKIVIPKALAAFDRQTC